MIGMKKKRNFSVYDTTNRLLTGHLTSTDRGASILQRTWILYIHEAVFKGGRMEITASVVLKDNKIGSQRFKFHTHTFPAQRGKMFVLDKVWKENELPPL